MKKTLLVALVALLPAACAIKPEAKDQLLGSGIDPANFDTLVRPQDDLYRYANGTWLDQTQIPADQSNYGTFAELDDRAELDIRAIIEEAANAENREPGSDVQKIGDFYRSFMDSARVEELGLAPLEEELNRIEAISSKDDLIRYMAYNNRLGMGDPVYLFVDQDEKDATRYILYLHQSGLGLPDRDYYFGDQFKDARTKYAAYIEKILDLAGMQGGKEAASTILDLETRLAENHWTQVQNRDRDATYNKYGIEEANQLTPNLNWRLFLDAAEAGEVDTFIVRQPRYLKALDRVIAQTPLDDWKTYFRFHLISAAAPYLPQQFVDARFDFYGRTLSGTEQNRPRWKRAVSAIDDALGEMVGKLYVERHFDPKSKERMDQMVQNLLKAFDQGIDELEWMADSTKLEAKAKLAKFRPKIGYPDKWKDYSALEVRPDDLFGNVMRSRVVEYRRELDKLGKPIDRDEWLMTPQTVNAYYNPSMNEIVFPAAILQPPFFNVEAEDAVNYGAIGAVIGHEISHGFDDQGRKSDGDGNLRDWWTPKDAEEFGKRTQVLVEQFNGFSPIEGMHVNGEFTLGENIGDLSGLSVAYKAYKLSLNGKESPVIDGFTGDQRFFLGWAQIWRRKYREDELRRRLITDPHSPSEYRTNGPVVHMPEFYTAFDVKEGDGMYRKPEQRTRIW